MDLDIFETNVREASELLKAMSNPHRLLVLCQLASGEKSVGQLESVVGLKQSALSQHLARLRRDRLVQARRSAQNVYYSLEGEEAQAIIETLYSLYCGPAIAQTGEPACAPPAAA